MNQKNSLGLNKCFLDKIDPIDLFEVWMNEAKKTELNEIKIDLNNSKVDNFYMIVVIEIVAYVFILNRTQGTQVVVATENNYDYTEISRTLPRRQCPAFPW